MTDQQSGICLKQARRFDAEFSAIAGVAAVVVVLMSMSAVAGGDWSALWFCVLPIGILLLGKFIQRQLAEHYVVLYPDRMEFPHRRGDPSTVTWAEVESIRWPKTGDKESQIRLTVPKESDRPFGRVMIDLQDVSRADELTLIRYLRTASATLEQSGWPQFCRKRAIPLVERLQQKELHGATGTPLARDAFLTSFNRFVGRRPFVGGMLCIVLLPLFLWRLVSRRMWWTLAIVIGTSGVLNIRLIWGAWVAPFAEYWLGVMAVLILAAVTSPPDDKRQERINAFSTTSVVGCLSAFIIGFPLLLNAMMLRWVWIPMPMPKAIGWLFVAFPNLLILIVMLRVRRQEQRDAAFLEDEAVRRWDEFSETGILPEARSCSPTSG